MQRLQAYKFELRQNGEQARKMRQFAGACRFVYNKALALQKARREVGEKHLGYASLCTHLTEWRSSAETPWLKEAHSQITQQALKDLERAYKNFFEKRAAFPRFKKRGQYDRFRFPQAITLDNLNGRIKLPKLGWMRYRKSRDVLGEVRNVTVSLSHGKWFVSIQTERTVEHAVAQGAAVGIDVGVARFATLSNGLDALIFFDSGIYDRNALLLLAPDGSFDEQAIISHAPNERVISEVKLEEGNSDQPTPAQQARYDRAL